MKGQSGQILLLTLIITSVGALTTGAMLAVATTTARSSGDFQETTSGYYAAAAGIELPMAYMLEGGDAFSLETCYSAPPITVNNIQPQVSITSPEAAGLTVRPKVEYRHIDPGVPVEDIGGMRLLGPGDKWRLKLNGVVPNTSLIVNWAYVASELPDVDITVFDGTGDVVERALPTRSTSAPILLMGRLGQGDTYTVEFKNDGDTPVLSRDFSSKGGRDFTWILAKATGREYLITSSTGEFALRAYIRQIPGPQEPDLENPDCAPLRPAVKQRIIVESWQGPVADTVPPPTPTPTPQAPPTPTPTPAPPVFHVPDLTADTAYRHVLGGDPDGSFVLAPGNLDAAGVTTDGTMIWVVDSADDRVYAYDTEGTAEPTGDFDLIVSNASPAGITIDGGNIRVVDSLAGVVYRYDAAGNHVDDFSLTAGNDDSTGLATDGTSIWVVDEIDDQVYRYNTAGAFLDSFSLNAANNSPKGITVDGADLWVVDSAARAVYRYTTAGAFMGLDFTLTAGNQDPQGITLGVAGPPDVTPPGSPTGLVGTSGDGQVSLDWDDNGEADLYGYNVKRATGSGGPYTIIASAVSSSDYADNTVTNDTTYYYVVSAVDIHANQSVTSTEVSLTPTDLTPPASPTGLEATPGDGQVSLDWDDNGEGDLAGYNVKRGTVSGGPYTTVATGVGISAYTDTTVTNDTTYFYVVSAIDGHPNESGNSNQASATPTDLTPPAAPAALEATAGDGQVTLDWADNSEGDLASYSVKRATATGGPYTTIATGVIVSAHTDTGVTNGTTYYYVVSAVDDSGNESANSSEVSATPTDSVAPAAPTGLVATSGDGQVSLDWDDNAEGDLDGYSVKRATSSGGPYSTIATGVSVSAYTDTTVTNDTTYFYVVSVVDTSTNESANSSEVSATPADPTPPAAPTGLVATAGDGQVSLDWDDNAEGDLDGYSVKRATSSGGPYSTIATGVSVSAYTDTTVTNDTTYFYVVSAVDTSANESADSSEVSATPTDTTPPAAPTGLVATAGDGQVSLDWDDNAEADLDGYNMKRATSSGGPYSTIATGVSVSAYTDTTVTNDTTYFYVVSAVDSSANESAESSEGSATPTDTTPPAAPTGLVATSGDGQVSLDWDDNAEGDLDGYNVKRATSSGGPYSTIATGVSVSAYTDTTVTNDTTYFYVVSAVDTHGNESANSSEDSATPQGAGTLLYFTVGSSGTVGGLNVANEDVIAFDGTAFTFLFDGSDVGLSGFKIDAMDVISATEILLSFTSSGTVPDISGSVDDSDIVKFTATQLGATTSGSFDMYFDGSDVNLSSSGEDVDAVKLTSDGRLLVSTRGSFSVSGVSGRDEDIVEFTPTSLGSSTSGSWALYFDGSDVGLTGSGEDVDGVGVDSAGKIYLSTTGNFSVSGVSGKDEDVFVFTPTTLGSSTSGTFDSTLFFDGSAEGVSSDLFAIDVP